MKIGEVVLGLGGQSPMVPIELYVRGKFLRSVEALLDTGFSGAVSLPLDVVEELGLEGSGDQMVNLADGSEIRVDVYIGFIGFAGERYRCAVLATGDIPTVGMHLLQGMKVCLEASVGGDIELVDVGV